MKFMLKFWGVRGSIPACQSPDEWALHISQILKQFFKSGYSRAEDVSLFLNEINPQRLSGYGSDTSCVEVKSDQGSLIIDAGSGIRRYGQSIMSGLKPNQEHHILFTHFHWDHILGLPFYAPIFRRDQTIHLYAVQEDLENAVRIKFSRPYFPVPYEMLPSKIVYHILEPRKKINILDFQVTPYQLDHPDPCWGYRIEKNKLSYSHCVDTEGTRVSRQDLGEDLPLYQNSDLMYFDAQYTLPELVEKSNWGHSAAQIGLDIAIRENIRYVVFGHHDPGASTQNLIEQAKQTREYHEWRVKAAESNRLETHNVKWRYGYDGMEVDLAKLKNFD